MHTTTIESMQVTAKTLKDAFKKGERCYVHCEKRLDNPSWDRASSVFALTVVQGHGFDDPKIVLERIPGKVINGHDDTTEWYQPSDGARYENYTGVFEPSRGYWGLSSSRLRDIVRTLPANALVSFAVYLDSHTNGNMVTARMHGDSISLVATWEERGKRIERTFLIDVSCGPHNSARFGNSRMY